MILAFLPWLDTSKVRSANYRPLYRQFFWLFVIVCIGLGWLGSKPPEGYYVLFARIFTVYYFALLPGHPADPRDSSRRPSRCRIRLRSRSCMGAPIGRRRRRPSERRTRHDFHARNLSLLPSRSPRLRRSGVGAGPRHTSSVAAEEQMVVRRPVRQVRPGPAPARLQGLSRGLPAMPRHAAARRSAISPSPAGPASRPRRRRRSRPNTSIRRASTTRASRSSATGRSPIVSRRR